MKTVIFILLIYPLKGVKAEERTSAGTFAAVALVSLLCLVQQSFVLASPPCKTKPIQFPPQLDPVHAQLSSNLFRGTTKELVSVFFLLQIIIIIIFKSQSVDGRMGR